VAAALEIQNGTIKQARLAMGGVAHKPWRASEAELVLTGARANEQIFRRAADAAMQGAHGYEHHHFKIELGKRAIFRALADATSEGRTT
jgi:xanthine dehydrogenase YagS FAD-binding subunit